jgi:hypothetical protein
VESGHLERTHGDHDIVPVLLSNALQALSDGRRREASCSNGSKRGVDGEYGESRHSKALVGQV